MIKIYNAATSSRVIVNKDPKISFGVKSGYIQINCVAERILKLKPGDRIEFGFDKENDRWLLIRADKKKSGAFELKRYQRPGKANPQLKITCRDLVREIDKSLPLNGNRSTFHMTVDVENPVAQEGLLTYKLDLVK